MEELIQSTPNMETSNIIHKRGRKKIYTDEEFKEKEKQRHKLYYRTHKDKAKLKQQKYSDCYKSYINLLRLIKQNKLSESTIDILIINNIINTKYFKYADRPPHIKDKNIVNGTDNSESTRVVADNSTK